jgi:hypothetical protein
VEGYINEARKVKTLILRNRRLAGESYTWHVTINIEMVQTPDQVADLWGKGQAKPA